MYVCIWEYRVRPHAASRFRQVYGPEGAWVALFRRAHGYVATQLCRDRDDRYRYVTVDTWESPGAYDLFRRDFAAEYARLDAECETLLLQEARLGQFDVEAG